MGAVLCYCMDRANIQDSTVVRDSDCISGWACPVVLEIELPSEPNLLGSIGHCRNQCVKQLSARSSS